MGKNRPQQVELRRNSNLKLPVLGQGRICARRRASFLSRQRFLPESLHKSLQIPAYPILAAVPPFGDLDFVRKDGNGKPWGSTDIGGSNAASMGQYFCLNARINIVPSEPGLPIVVFGTTAKLSEWRDMIAAKDGARVSFFAGIATNKWCYRGKYAESSTGIITSSDIRRLSEAGKKWWCGLFDAQVVYAKKDGLGVNRWGMRATIAVDAMQEMEERDGIEIPYAVYKCVGVDEEGLAGWIVKRDQRLIQMAELAAKKGQL